MVKARRYVDADGVEWVEDTFYDDVTGRECGTSTYPYISPEERERMESERVRRLQIEEQKKEMQSTILTQVLLNQAQLISKLKEGGVIE